MAWSAGFDGLYGQDAFAYHDYSVGPMREALGQLRPPPPFHWPPGYPVLAALATLLFGPTPLAGQAVSLGASAAFVLFTALLAREVQPRGPVWLLAGSVAALPGILWVASLSVRSDALASAAVAGSFWAAGRFGRRSKAGWLVAAAALMSLAVLTRWASAVPALVVAGYSLTVLWGWFRRSPRDAALAAGGAALTVIVVLWPVIAPLARVVSGSAAAEATGFVGNFGLVWDPLNAFRSAFLGTDGRFEYPLPNALFHGLAVAHPAALTPVFALFVLPGIVAAARGLEGEPERTVLRRMVLLGWPAANYFFLVGVPLQSMRFLAGSLAPLAILAALGASELWDRVGERWRPVVTGLVGVGLLWLTVGAVGRLGGLIAFKEQNLAVVAWVETVASPGDTLLTFGLTHTFDHYGSLRTMELYLLDDESLPRAVASDRDVFLLLDLENVQTQWRGRPPHGNFAWLAEHRTLEPLGENGPWRLFRVVDEAPAVGSDASGPG